MKHITALALIMSASTAIASGHGNPGGHFIESWDLDGNGAVSLAEAIERRSDVFTSFDADDNGILDSAEYDFFDEARAADMKENGMGHGKGKRNPANGMLREFTDANKDGEVTLKEFMDAVPSWYANIDKNGDGTVTAIDFAKK